MTEGVDKKEILIESGKVLYGERWQTDLARDLGLSDARRIRQWLADERPIPDGIVMDLQRLLMTRHLNLAKVVHKVNQAAVKLSE